MGLPGLRLLDSYFRPGLSLKRTDVPPIPYMCCRYDFTMTSPKGHVPPSQRSSANKKTALADKHLIVKERQLMLAGACDTTTNTSLDGDDIYNRLNYDGFIVWPVGISPHGRWGAIFHNNIIGKEGEIITNSLILAQRRKHMHRCSMSYTSPIGIIPLATATW